MRTVARIPLCTQFPRLNGGISNTRRAKIKCCTGANGSEALINISPGFERRLNWQQGFASRLLRFGAVSFVSCVCANPIRSLDLAIRIILLIASCCFFSSPFSFVPPFFSLHFSQHFPVADELSASKCLFITCTRTKMTYVTQVCALKTFIWILQVCDFLLLVWETWLGKRQSNFYYRDKVIIHARHFRTLNFLAGAKTGTKPRRTRHEMNSLDKLYSWLRKLRSRSAKWLVVAFLLAFCGYVYNVLRKNRPTFE